MSLDTYDNPGLELFGQQDANQKRPYISVLFECCHIYVRLYRKPEDMFYEGRCPKCLRTLNVRVGPEGTPARIFTAE